MSESVFWFCGQIVFALAMLAVGCKLGKVGGRAAVIAMVASVILLVGWSLRLLQPTLYFNIVPLDILVYIEGTANVPAFMLFIGLVWKHRTDKRAQRAGPPLIALALVYFLWNALWMILPYPLGKQSIQDPYIHAAAHGGVIMQYSSDACVAAAAATAMLAHGIDQPINEAEMIRLTDTRVTRGSTVIRAVRGLRTHLADTEIQVDLVKLDADAAANLATLSLPILAPLKSGIGSLHMVVIYGHPPDREDVFQPDDGRAPTENQRSVPLFQFATSWFDHFPKDMREYVIIGNPIPEQSDVAVNVPSGIHIMTMERFRKLYRGPAIVFRKPNSQP
ncbi:MAG: hypothetical protein KAS72_09545 [Phycisphaerales bacterium]|nr:hypothetical protein [Phycisphaerales bacterium]